LISLIWISMRVRRNFFTVFCTVWLLLPLLKQITQWTSLILLNTNSYCEVVSLSLIVFIMTTNQRQVRSGEKTKISRNFSSVSLSLSSILSDISISFLVIYYFSMKNFSVSFSFFDNFVELQFVGWLCSALRQ
jgi:hypothetical protein